MPKKEDGNAPQQFEVLLALSDECERFGHHEEAIKCLEAASNVIDAVPLERAGACVRLAVLVLNHFENVEFAREKLLQAERIASSSTATTNLTFQILSLLGQCQDDIDVFKKGVQSVDGSNSNSSSRLSKRWKAHFLFHVVRCQVAQNVDDESIDGTLESLDALSPSLSYEERTVLAMTRAVVDMKRQRPDAADRRLTETATELGNAFAKHGKSVSLESLRAHYYLLYALNAQLSGRAGQLVSDGTYPVFDEFFKSIEKIDGERLEVGNVVPPLDNACASILGEMLQSNILRMSGHGSDAALPPEESLESLIHSDALLKKPVIQLQLLHMEYACLAALVMCDFQGAAKELGRAGSLLEQHGDILKPHVMSYCLLLGQYFHSTREYDTALALFNSIATVPNTKHKTMAVLCAALTELHDEHSVVAAAMRMKENDLDGPSKLNSLPTHERSVAQMVNGLILCRQSDTTGARLLLTKALKQAHGMIGSGQFVGQILNCLAPVQQERQDHAGALQMFESSATLVKSVKDLMSLVTTLVGMEKLYEEMKNEDKAASCRQYLQKKAADLTSRLQVVYDSKAHKECIRLANVMQKKMI